MNSFLLSVIQRRFGEGGSSDAYSRSRLLVLIQHLLKVIFRFAFFRISFTKVNLINTKTTPATMFDFVIIFASRVFLYIRWVLVWFLVFGQKNNNNQLGDRRQCCCGCCFCWWSSEAGVAQSHTDTLTHRKRGHVVAYVCVCVRAANVSVYLGAACVCVVVLSKKYFYAILYMYIYIDL